MVLEVLSGLEAGRAALLRAFVWLVVSLVHLHVRLTLLLRVELCEAVSALCVVADVERVQRRSAKTHLRNQEIVEVERVLALVQGLIQQRVPPDVLQLIVVVQRLGLVVRVRVVEDIGEDFEATLFEVEGDAQLLIALATNAL